MYTEFISDNALVQHNHEPTRYMVGQKPSLIDQFISNCPQNIDGIETIKSHIADHCLVNLRFHTKDLIQSPQFMKKRDTRNLIRENIAPLIIQNIELNSVFTMTNTNKIAQIILTELNDIIEYLAPSRIVQVRIDNLPYINEETREYIREADIQLNLAITSKDVSEWRIYKYMRNRISEVIEAAKLYHYTKMLSKSRDMWRTISQCTKTTVSSVPRLIISNGDTITSPKKLAELANLHFKAKIEII